MWAHPPTLGTAGLGPAGREGARGDDVTACRPGPGQGRQQKAPDVLLQAARLQNEAFRSWNVRQACRWRSVE